jgi:hypothetical protein
MNNGDARTRPSDVPSSSHRTSIAPISPDPVILRGKGKMSNRKQHRGLLRSEGTARSTSPHETRLTRLDRYRGLNRLIQFFLKFSLKFGEFPKLDLQSSH